MSIATATGQDGAPTMAQWGQLAAQLAEHRRTSARDSLAELVRDDPQYLSPSFVDVRRWVLSPAGAAALLELLGVDVPDDAEAAIVDAGERAGIVRRVVGDGGERSPDPTDPTSPTGT